MIEVASALQGCVRFMIASQDEVPDVSFPYRKNSERLRGHGRDPKDVCRLIPKIYLQSFRDYLVTLPQRRAGDHAFEPRLRSHRKYHGAK